GGVQEALLHGLVPEAGDIDPSSIVACLDTDEPRLMVGVQTDDAVRWLAQSGPFFSALEPVDNGVLHEMEQRITDLLDDAPVHRTRLAADPEFHVLASHAGRLPDHWAEPPEQQANRYHSRAGDLASQATHQPLERGGIRQDHSNRHGKSALNLGEVGRN